MFNLNYPLILRQRIKDDRTRSNARDFSLEEPINR